MHVLYLGTNKDTIGHLEGLLNRKLTVVETPFQARSYIFKNFNTHKQPIFVFIESTDTEDNLKRIELLKQNRISNQYLLLIAGEISKELRHKYIDYGVNDIIDISISRQSLQQLLLLLPRLKHSEKQQPMHLFKLPLWKRCFDILFTLAALLVLSPVFILTALAICLESKGPAIYTSQRVGSNYKIFGFLKFRSMYADADKRLSEFKKLNQYQGDDTHENEVYSHYVPQAEQSGTIFVGDDFRLTEKEYLKRRSELKKNNFIKLQNDPRITKVGRIIRKYSIDELPQLFNILKGDMSIVGNRPLPLYEAEQLTSDEYIERFMAPAGLTGLWQVEKRGTEGILSAEERKQLDIQYARKFSFLLDVKIIFRTFTAFIQKENV